MRTARAAVRGVREDAEAQAEARRAHGGAGARTRRTRDDARGERGRGAGEDVLRKRARGGWIRRARVGVDGELSTTRGDAVALAENRAVLDFATTGARRVTTTNSTRHTDITRDAPRANGARAHAVSKMFVARCTSSFARRNARAAAASSNPMDASNRMFSALGSTPFAPSPRALAVDDSRERG